MRTNQFKKAVFGIGHTQDTHAQQKLHLPQLKCPPKIAAIQHVSRDSTLGQIIGPLVYYKGTSLAAGIDKGYRYYTLSHILLGYLKSLRAQRTSSTTGFDQPVTSSSPSASSSDGPMSLAVHEDYCSRLNDKALNS